MITPKEKAIELVNRFIDYVNCWDDESADPNYTQAYNYAQECALIHLNGIIDFIWSIDGYDEQYYEYLEIKKEIEKLKTT